MFRYGTFLLFKYTLGWPGTYIKEKNIFDYALQNIEFFENSKLYFIVQGDEIEDIFLRATLVYIYMCI